MQHPSDLSEDHHTHHEPVRIDKDKKERKGFWDGMLRDREKDKWRADKERERDRERLDRIRDKDRREDDLSTAEMTRMIGMSLSAASIPHTDCPFNRLPYRDCVRGLVHCSRSLRKSICQ